MAAKYEYKVIKQSSHTKLSKALNEEAAGDWEPVTVYSLGINSTDHFALLRRAL